MNDLHRGFQDVDQSESAESFFRFLDGVAAVPAVQAYRKQMMELCPPADGQQILDVGCGLGHSALHLASLVGAEGKVVGIDKSAQLIDEALRRARGRNLPLSYQVGDAGQIDFPDHSFDLCRTERMLMYLAQPQQALAEMVRVLRPGGMLLCFEFDYEGIVVDAADLPLTRQISNRVTDAVPSPWIGRQLPRQFRHLGLQAVTVTPHFIPTPYAIFRQVVSGALVQAVERGAFSEGMVAEWWRELEAAAVAGDFFAGFSGFLVSGCKPLAL